MAELVSYRDIVPHLDINAPRLIYQNWEAQPSESVVLLFEDMATRRPTYFPNGFATLDYGQAARISRRWRGSRPRPGTVPTSRQAGAGVPAPVPARTRA